MAVDGLGSRSSTYTPSGTPTPAGPGATGTPIPTSGVPTEVPVDATGVAGQAFVDGKVKTGVVVDPNVLSEGAAVSAELLAELHSLQGLAGASNGLVSAQGDVEISVSAGEFFTFPSADQLGSIASGLDAVLTSDDTILQGQVVDLFSGVATNLEFVQVHSGQMIFGSGFNIEQTRQRLGTFTGELNAQTGPQPLPFSAGATHALNEQFLDRQPVDINLFVQWVLRESYLDFTEDLKMYADKVRFYNDLKKEIRAEMQAARETLRTCAGLAETDALPDGVYEEKDFNETYLGEDPVAAGTMSPEELEEYNAELQRQEDVQTNVDEYNKALKNAGTTTTTIGSGPPNHDPGSHVGTATSGADEYAAQMIKWYNELSPTEQAAFRQKLEESGMTVNGAGRDHDDWSSSETGASNHTCRPLEPGEDMDEYIKEMCSEMGAELEASCAAAGSATVPYDFSFSMSSPTFPLSEDVQDPSKADFSKVDLAFLKEQGYDVDAKEPLTVGQTDDGSSLSEGGPIDTKGELEDYIDKLEEKLSSVGDDAQLANVDLQNILQKQQQVMQMMSNLSKQIHDTMLNTIRKIGG